MDSRELLDAWYACRNGLRNRARSYLFDTDEVDDAMQEVFIRAYAKRGLLGDPEGLRRYAFGILRNYCLDRYREYRVQMACHLYVPTAVKRSVSPDAEQRVLVREVEEAVQEMRPRDQAVLALYVEDRTVVEESEMTGLPTTTIHSRRRSTIRRLRRRLGLFGD